MSSDIYAPETERRRRKKQTMREYMYRRNEGKVAYRRGPYKKKGFTPESFITPVLAPSSSTEFPDVSEDI